MKTILLNPGKCEFNFQVNRPLVLPAYNVVTEEVYFTKDQEELKEERLRENEQVPTYVGLSISLDPPIELPNENE